MGDKYYTYDQVLEASIEYFNDSALPAQAFVDKYALINREEKYVDLTPDDMHDRLASEFARIDSEKYNLDFNEQFLIYRDAIDKFARIVPQGSVMNAVGNPYYVMSASNCVVVESPEDSIGGIMSTATALAELYKRRAGVGTDLSTLRPDGTPVSNAAKTSTGAWSFADLYSHITKKICQNARRGALMLTLDVHHPDVKKFSSMKLDNSAVTNANVSVRLSDEFMKAVDNNQKYEQRWPCEGKPKISNMVDASDVWQSIIYGATKCGCPGVMFWDNMCNNLPAHSYPQFKNVSTNPCCVTSDTIIMTYEGPRRISELHNRPFKAIVNGKPYDAKRGSWVSGKGKVYELITDAGYKIKLTKDHMVLTDVGWIKSKDLNNQHKIVLNDNSNIEKWSGEGNFGEGYLLGLLVGDGNLSVDGKNHLGELKVWKKDGGHSSIISESNKYANVLNMRSDWKGWRERDLYYVMSIERKLTDKFGIYPNNKVITPNIEKSSYDFHCGFLRGYFDANGHIEGSQEKGYSIRLSSSVYENLEKTQIMLSHMGIKSAIRLLHNERQTLLPDGKGGKKLYECKANYRLIISSSSISKFHYHIGFSHKEKKEKLENIIFSTNFYKDKFFTKLKSFKYVGEEEVWDAEVDNVHAFDANGIYVHNSEISLSAFDSCRLMSINLTGYIKNAFENNAFFDFDMFKKDIHIAMQMIDNLVDLEIELVSNIIDKCDNDFEKSIWQKLKKSGENGRRTGLGTHGLADTLAQLSIKYDSYNAGAMIDQIYKTLRNEAYNASIELAKVRGAFPAFDWNIEKDNLFIKRLPQNIQDNIKKYGRRNISLLTQAPTGTVSIVSKVGEFDAYNVSSGIEPVFRNSYIKKKKVNHGDKNVRVDSCDKEGESWQHFRVNHSNVNCYMDKFNIDINNLPEFFVTSDKIDWKKRVELQGIEQKYIDHSISSTVNLPKGTEPEKVGEIYMHAWKSGLKGITVYVDGSKDNVLVSDEDTLDENGRPLLVQQSQSPKRPNILPCEIHYSTVMGVKWCILVGLLKGVPYEIFMGEADKFNIPKKYTYGKIIKVKSGKYNLLSNDDQILINNIVQTADNEDGAWTTRIMSMSLRHGIPVEYLVEQLSKDGSMVDINNVLARLLKKYIKKRQDTGVDENKEKCPKCGGTDLIYSESCVKCPCGWGGCG